MSLKERAVLVQGGYVAGRAQQLTVHKPARNVLAGRDKRDRDPERSPTPASEQPAAATPPPVSAAVEKQLSDLVEEIRKLKSVIVKQENRIRALEATVKTSILPPPTPEPVAPVAAPTPPAVAAEQNHDTDDGMAPDEV